MGFIKWRFPHYSCYFWGGHYRCLQPSLALVKWSLKWLCCFIHTGITLSQISRMLHMASFRAVRVVSIWEEQLHNRENTLCELWQHIPAGSLAPDEATAGTWKGKCSLCLVCHVKADETTLSGQEAARPQQTKNKQTVRLHTADVSDGAHIYSSVVFCFKFLGWERCRGY